MCSINLINLSVVIPTYNYGKFIGLTINSVINQQLSVKEIIVIDDGSTDNTKQIVKKLIKNNKSHVIKYYFQNNKGVSAARNFGYTKTTGDYIIFLDADDKMCPDAFTIIKKSIDLNENYDMYIFGYRSISIKGASKLRIPKPLCNENLINVYTLLQGDMVGIRPSTTVLRSHVLRNLKFNEHVHIGEDILFFAHVLNRYKCISIKSIITDMPRHEGSLRDNYLLSMRSGIYGINELFEELPVTKLSKYYKREMLIRRYLQMGRHAYLSRNFLQAKNNYLAAFKIKPFCLFSKKHLPRAIFSVCRSI